MTTPDTTISRASEPSSAPPEFLWEDVSGIRQYNLGASSGTLVYYQLATGSEPWATEIMHAPLGGESQRQQGGRESGWPYDVKMIPSSSEPPLFFSEGSNLDSKYAIRSVFGGSGYQTILIGAETSIIKSALPVQEWELSQQYGELREALKDLVALEEEDEWRIEESVYAAASYYAAELRSGSIPAPQVSVHGPKSVVFNWSNELYNLYLTISANNVSALLSSRERIIQRKEYSKNQLASPLALLYFCSENPPSAVSNLSESVR